MPLGSKLLQCIGVTGLLVTYTNALIRFACSQLSIERLDPLVTPGQISPHLHQIIGGVR
ncbi:hypothetical protein FA15DRAFT_600757 [Coprinopsis marcescibilis]|uniref:DUF1996 domain-containing protein n=1 Tax=Coprinopsis marcescibilis TaxID=230819 RepID=A0A5C3KIY1_COPMA|nr:hypothetical protein FA15DRAFT_600757 [Coprinopsis marcescibilis]